MKIALLTTWNAVCGVSEYGYFLTEALRARGHEVTIIANTFGGGLVQHNARRDDGNVHRLFDTGFTKEAGKVPQFPADKIYDLLQETKTTVLLVSYQDYLFPCKREFNALIQRFTEQPGNRSYMAFHDTCFGPDVNYGLFTGCVLPSKQWQVFPPNARRTYYIGQGIPEFGELSFDRELYRKERVLPTLEKPARATLPYGYLLSSFGLGRCMVEKVLGITEYINQYNLLPKPINLLVSVAQPSQYGDYDAMVSKYKSLFISKGYLEPLRLAQMIYASDAAVIWYPEIGHKATSSALRFAIGAKTPTIASLNGWTKDMAGTGAWLEVLDGTADGMKAAIINLFNNYKFKRDRQERLCAHQIAEQGWSKIAAQWEDLFK